MALFSVIIMAISCFLPWAEVSSQASFMGQSSSFYSSASGIQAGVGIITLLISVVCGIMVFIKSRFMIVPGLMNLGFSILQTIGMKNVSSDVVTSYGSGHAGAGYGLLVLAASSLVYVIATIRNLRKPKTVNPQQPISSSTINNSIQPSPMEEVPTKQETVYHEPIIPIVTNHAIVDNSKQELPKHEKVTEPVSPPVIAFKNDTKKLSRFNKVLIIIGIVIGVYTMIFVWADLSSESYNKERQLAEQTEKSRIELILTRVNELVSAKRFDDALIEVNNITWMHNPSMNSDFVKIYDDKRESLKNTIVSLKARQDSIEAAANVIVNPVMEVESTLISSANNTFIYPEQIINNFQMGEAIKRIIQNNDLNYDIKYLEDDNRYYSVTKKITAETYTYYVIKGSIEQYQYFLYTDYDEINRMLTKNGYTKFDNVDKLLNYSKGCYSIAVSQEEGLFTLQYSWECD
ncbi:MAG: hypothetical protein IPK08_19555 [Bacteroidetes bacterium]|nr:hypothetical protein [Bacteroidota bacterium]